MTASAALLPIAAATAQLVVRGVSDVLKQGTAFADMLLPSDESTPAAQVAATTTDADGALELTNDSRVVRWKTAWQNVTAQTNAIHQMLVEKFAGEDIDLSEPVTLRTDADGRILVANGHPDRADIEQLLESDSELSGQLHQLFRQLADLECPSGSQQAPNISGIRLVVSKDRAFFAGE